MAKRAGCKGILVMTGGGKGSLGEYRYTWNAYEADFIANDALETVKIGFFVIRFVSRYVTERFL